jgi:very-short-patch-repair endonuclease
MFDRDERDDCDAGNGKPGQGRPGADSVIEQIAARQHGVVTRSQLLHAGIGGGALDRRLKSDRLHRLHQGVYRVGPVCSPRLREMAAVLACGEGSVLGYRSAAVLWDLVAGGAAGPMEVIAVGHNVRRPGVRAHRSRGVAADEVTRREGIPITRPGRTLCDLACWLSQRELERAAAKAVAAGLTDHDELMSLTRRHAGRRGIATLKAVTGRDTPPALTRSEAEERFLTMVRRARLPEPRVNVRVHGLEVDFYWGPERFAVEVDGFSFHSSNASFDADRRRDAHLAAAGIRVTRVTWRQLVNEPEAVLVRLAQALVHEGPHPASIVFEQANSKRSRPQRVNPQPA